MARSKLAEGKASTAWEARRQVLTDEGKYRAAKPGERVRATDRWRAQGSVRDDHGRLVVVSRYGKKKTEVEGALTAALAERRSALPESTIMPTMTLRQAAEAWRLDVTRHADLSESTRRLYFHALDRHVLGLSDPANLADVELRNVKVSNLEPALRAVAKSSGLGMLKTTRTVYRAVLSLAVRHDAIPHNPVSDLGTLKVKPLVRETDRDTRRAFTRAERDRVIGLADTDPRAVARDLGDLLDRIRTALLRVALQDERVFALGDLVVDLGRQMVQIGEDPIQLTATEYDLLRVLVLNAGRLLTQSRLAQEVWRERSDEDALQMLRTTINTLRQKLDTNPARPRFIVLEPGVGYRLRIAPSISPA